MCKETASREATDCICGGTFAFMEYHWPHCPMNPVNLSGSERAHMETKFSKVQLDGLAVNGPVSDQKISKHGKRGRR